MSNEKNQTINSHVQQPKLILKQFCNENGELYYYSFAKDTINKGHPKTLNTKLDYYSVETESFLNRTIETPLGEAIKEVVKYRDVPHSGLRLNKVHLDAIQNYIYATIVRGEEFQKGVAEKSILAFLLNEQERHDVAVQIGINNIKEDDLLDEFIIAFGVNRTEIPFVLPLMGLYEFSQLGKPCLCLPLSPHVALLYFDKNVAKEVFDVTKAKGYPYIFNFCEEAIIDGLNRWAYNSEKTLNKQMLISNKKEVLERLLCKMQA